MIFKTLKPAQILNIYISFNFRLTAAHERINDDFRIKQLSMNKV